MKEIKKVKIYEPESKNVMYDVDVPITDILTGDVKASDYYIKISDLIRIVAHLVGK